MSRTPAGDRADVLQANWAPATRVIVGTAGAALAAAGAFRRDVPGIPAMLIGSGLFARAVTNLPLNCLTGIASRRRGVDVQKTITINAPVGEVYAFWSMFENFPRFMSRVLDVGSSERTPMQSHWKVAGPAGVPVEFDAEITQAIPNHLMAWRTLAGSLVAHAGIVRFDPEMEGRTRVQRPHDVQPACRMARSWDRHHLRRRPEAQHGRGPPADEDADRNRARAARRRPASAAACRSVGTREVSRCASWWAFRTLNLREMDPGEEILGRWQRRGICAFGPNHMQDLAPSIGHDH
jgi:uncharacterized membrane protein